MPVKCAELVKSDSVKEGEGRLQVSDGGGTSSTLFGLRPRYRRRVLSRSSRFEIEVFVEAD